MNRCIGRISRRAGRGGPTTRSLRIASVFSGAGGHAIGRSLIECGRPANRRTPNLDDIVSNMTDTPPRATWRDRLYTVIFEHDTFAGRAFDVALIVAILASVVAVLLESMSGVRAAWGPQLRTFEWAITLAFTLEYVLRLVSARGARKYARSFYGIIDLLSVLPTWISFIIPGGQVLSVVRILRVLRIFRVLKMARYIGEANLLAAALRQSRAKITIFVFTVLTVVVVVGALLYLIEGPASGFDSIPRAMYWAIVTLTTVGYGDIAPITPVGQTLAAIVMILGYGIIAVPTGIFTMEIANASRAAAARGCPGCGLTGHDGDAIHCKRCGTLLGGPVTPQ